MLNNLKADKRKLVTIIDPHTKIDEDYWIYKNSKEMNLAVKTKDGADYENACWPEQSIWFDYFKLETREYIK
jgi:alpha 1,3-glucosidase